MIKTTDKNMIEKMFEAGAHFGYSRTKRHPSIKKFIFGAKNRVEIFDLEKTNTSLEEVIEFVKSLGSEGKQILFVSSKSEAKEAIETGAKSIDAPYVAGRWIGGTLTNADQIKKRVERFQKLESDKEKGQLSKYTNTKKERLLIDREIDKLGRKFSGLVNLSGTPAAMFIVDSKKEEIALNEAVAKNIPIISLVNSDCNIQNINYPITANDSSRASISFFVNAIVEAYKEGLKNPKIKTETSNSTDSKKDGQIKKVEVKK